MLFGLDCISPMMTLEGVLNDKLADPFAIEGHHAG
jgi:hypothetical protein